MTMKLFWRTLLVVSALSCATGRRHNAKLKSLLAVDRECNQYSTSDSYGQCQTRCQGILGRFWDDSDVVPAVTLGRFYQPDCDDHSYLNRTEQCLGEVTDHVRRNDDCLRATCTVKCYTDQYGQLDAESPSYIPTTKLQYEQIYHDCAAILQIDPHSIRDLGDPDARCLLRCFMIRQGLYSDAEGPNLDRMYVQCGGYVRPDEFRQKALKCVERLRYEPLDACSRAYWIAKECVNVKGAVMQNFGGLGGPLGGFVGGSKPGSSSQNALKILFDKPPVVGGVRF